MPALLTDPTQFQNSLLGHQLAAYLPDGEDITYLDRAIFEASSWVQRYCGRKLAAPPATTVGGTAPTAPGSLSIPVASVANIDQLDVAVFTGTAETIEIAGADVTGQGGAPYPYPGTLTLTTPTATSHSPGDPIQIYRQERYEIRGRKTGAGTDDGLPFSQEGQVAQMHAPKFGFGVSSRLIFLREYPVLSLFAAFETLPWSNAETTVSLQAIYLAKEEGWYRLPVGFYNPQATMWRTQYAAGFCAGPDDHRDAVHHVVAAKLAQSDNPLGATSIRSGDQSFTNPTQAYMDRAIKILEAGNYVRKGMV